MGECKKIKLQVKKGAPETYVNKERTRTTGGYFNKPCKYIYMCVWGRGGTEERSIIVPPADVMLNFKAAPSISNNNPSKGCNEHTHTHTMENRNHTCKYICSLRSWVRPVFKGWRCDVLLSIVKRASRKQRKRRTRLPRPRFSPLSQPRKGWGRRQLSCGFNQQWSSTGGKLVIAGMLLAFTT